MDLKQTVEVTAAQADPEWRVWFPPAERSNYFQIRRPARSANHFHKALFIWQTPQSSRHSRAIQYRNLYMLRSQEIGSEVAYGSQDTVQLPGCQAACRPLLRSEATGEETASLRSLF